MTDPVFFPPAPALSVGYLAEQIGARLVDPGHHDVQITHAAPLPDSGAGCLVYVDAKHAAELTGLTASAVICRSQDAEKVPAGMAVLATDHPRQAFAAALRLLYPSAALPGAITAASSVDPRAVVDPSARLEDNVVVEAYAVIGAGAEIGAGSIIGPHAVVGPECRIGRDSRIGSHVTVQNALMGNRVILHPGVRIGQDGFGYIGTRQGPEKVLQVGRVIIQDDVEVGANTAIDRGALADTVIGEKTKIDNLVQIAHNVEIGRGCVIAGMCGISGSVRIGNYVQIGGGAGLADHVSVGDGAQIAARSGLMHDVPAGEKWGGAPAQPMRKYMREIATLRAAQEKDRAMRKTRNRE